MECCPYSSAREYIACFDMKNLIHIEQQRDVPTTLQYVVFVIYYLAADISITCCPHANQALREWKQQFHFINNNIPKLHTYIHTYAYVLYRMTLTREQIVTCSAHGITENLSRCTIQNLQCKQSDRRTRFSRCTHMLIDNDFLKHWQG